LNADIEGLENCIRDYLEQLQFERAKSDQLELIVSYSSIFLFLRMSVIIYYYYYLLCESYQSTQKIIQKTRKKI